MNSEPDLLRIEVVDDEMVVSLAKSQLSVTYYKSINLPSCWQSASQKNMIRARR
jgi:ubiquitin C-terminal hydrolase